LNIYAQLYIRGKCKRRLATLEKETVFLSLRQRKSTSARAQSADHKILGTVDCTGYTIEKIKITSIYLSRWVNGLEKIRLQ
jgi:hypothetical protein